MAESQPGSSRHWRRTVDRDRAFNSSRECLKSVELLVRVTHGATVTMNAYFSEHSEDCYISRDALEPLGWDYQTDKIRKRKISPWGILKPIGSVQLCVRQPSKDPTTPFKTITFHVVEGSPSQNSFGLVIGQSGCNEILGKEFNFVQFNENCRRKWERQRRREQEQEQALR
ncbi:hypothetical protein QBC40DRAFT_172317 [Triangularia verruculosa]|uniref:Uncharacterized protein n=1 Tax=Triangularia verruculosa TaxID=2587418 RepID=A0AAN6XKW3_9PEZI|nr:hypothetical protein QBC40DRAFT_172317 [Triangularia verruculosa]